MLITTLLLAVVTIKCVANKISILALLMYIEEHGNVPSENEIQKYTSRAAKKLFHIPS